MVKSGRRQRGARAYRAGLAAEGSVQRAYERKGYRLRDMRWRGQAGEIDLIFSKDVRTIFVEVKRANDFATAAARLRPDQLERILLAGEEYSARLPLGQLSEMRVDAAFVNDLGQVKVVANVLAM